MTDNLKNKFHDTQYNHWKDMKGYAFTSQGKAVLYAGPGNWERSALYADKHGMVRIQKTQGGALLFDMQERKVLESVSKAKQSLRPSQTNQISGETAIWRANSRHYAASITGKLQTFVCGANKASVFRQAELPTVLNNKKITTINGQDRAALQKFYHQTFDRLKAQGMERRQAADQAKAVTHRKVAMAEVRQDLSIAKAAGDP